jgi:hypothetical protein
LNWMTNAARPFFKRVGAMTQTFLTTTKIDHIGFPKDLEHRTYTVHQGQVLVKG